MGIRFLDDEAPAKATGKVRFLADGEVPYKPTWLENAADAVNTGMAKVAPFMAAGQKIQDVMSPDSGMAQMGIGLAQQGLDRLGEGVAEYAGKLGASPYVGGTLGMAAANAPAFFIPNPEGAISGAVRPFAAPLEKSVASGISTVFGPSTEAIEARLANPAKIRNAASYANLAERVPKTLSKIQDKISIASEKADSLLKQSTDAGSGGIPKSRLQSVLDELRQSLQTGGAVIGDAEKAASAKLSSTIADIDNILKAPDPQVKLLGPQGKEIPGTKPEVYISEGMLKRVIRSLRENVNFQDKSVSATNKQLTNASGQLDSILKTQNPEYAEKMKDVAKVTRLADDTRDAFSIESPTGVGPQFTNATVDKIKALPTERRAASQNVARRIKAVTGEDYIADSKDYGYAQQFEGGKTQGSRRVNMGGIVGAGIGSFFGGGWAGSAIGSAVGGGVGATIDSFGGKMAGGLVDRYVGTNKFVTKVGSNAASDLVATTMLTQASKQTPRQNVISQYIAGKYGLPQDDR